MPCSRSGTKLVYTRSVRSNSGRQTCPGPWRNAQEQHRLKHKPHHSPLSQSLVESLDIQSAAHGRALLTKIICMFCPYIPVVGVLILSGLDDGEVVPATALLQSLESNHAGL